MPAHKPGVSYIKKQPKTINYFNHNIWKSPNILTTQVKLIMSNANFFYTKDKNNQSSKRSLKRENADQMKNNKRFQIEHIHPKPIFVDKNDIKNSYWGIRKKPRYFCEKSEIFISCEWIYDSTEMTKKHYCTKAIYYITAGETYVGYWIDN